MCTLDLGKVWSWRWRGCCGYDKCFVIFRGVGLFWGCYLLGRIGGGHDSRSRLVRDECVVIEETLV